MRLIAATFTMFIEIALEFPLIMMGDERSSTHFFKATIVKTMVKKYSYSTVNLQSVHTSQDELR